MINKQEIRIASGNVFNELREYYKQDWHDYYPTIIHLVPNNSNVLDVGCGRGGLLEYLRDKKNCRVVGIDISDNAIQICSEKGINVMKCDLDVDEISGTYDVIILSAVVEHLIEPLPILTKLRNNLNKNGCIIVGVPNFSHLIARIQYLLGRNVKRFGDDEIDMKLGIQPPGHIQFFNKSTLSYLLTVAGYRPIGWSYYKQPSFLETPNSIFLKRLASWIFYKLYQIDHEIFSAFIAVKAVKINDKTDVK